MYPLFCALPVTSCKVEQISPGWENRLDSYYPYLLLMHKMLFPHLESLFQRECQLQTLQTSYAMRRIQGYTVSPLYSAEKPADTKCDTVLLHVYTPINLPLCLKALINVHSKRGRGGNIPSPHWVLAISQSQDIYHHWKTKPSLVVMWILRYSFHAVSAVWYNTLVYSRELAVCLCMCSQG